MKPKNSKKFRMNLYIPVDINEKLELWSEKIELPKSNLINLAIRAGLDSIIRAIDPTAAFDPETWAQIVKAIKPEDVNLESEKMGKKTG